MNLNKLSKGKLVAFALGNCAIVWKVLSRLSKIKNSGTLPANTPVFTLKNILFGYIAVSGSLASLIVGILQFTAYSNVASNYPNFILSKYFSYCIDPNVNNPIKTFDKKLFYQRLFYFSLFALHHSIFARNEIKALLNDHNIIPQRIERSVFVLASNYLLYLMLKNWNYNHNCNTNNDKTDKKSAESINATVSINTNVAGTESSANNNEKNKIQRGFIWKIPKFSELPWYLQYLPFFAFIMLGQRAQAAAEDGELFMGVTQAFDFGVSTAAVNRVGNNGGDLFVRGLYSMVRHPQMFFNVLAFLSVPKMSLSRLTLMVFFGIYVFVGVQFEEKGLIQEFGNQYISYQKQVPQLIPTWPLFKNVVLPPKSSL